MRRLLRAALPLSVMLVACDRRPSEPVTFIVQADSLIEISEDTLPDGSITANCNISMKGTVEGPAGESAIMRGGRVRYWWWATGTDATTYEWTPEAAHNFWIDSIIDVGEQRISRVQGFGQSMPPQLVRAEISFDYATTNNDSVRQTPVFRYYCY